MTKPNFFIVGAPKCGTTSIYESLSEHKDVYLCDPKEPNYFARELSTEYHKSISNEYLYEWNSYLDLFKENNDVKIIGDCSTRYLRSRSALKEINSKIGTPKILVLIRNPVELAISWHSQKVKEGQEMQLDFEKAWKLQEDRLKGSDQGVGRLLDKDALMYKNVSSIGSQLEYIYDLFSPSNICVILLDDLIQNFEKQLRRLTDFLEIDYHYLSLNQSNKRPENVPLGYISLKSKMPESAINLYKKNKKWLYPIANGLRKISTYFGSQKIIKPSIEFKNQMTREMKDEIDKVEKVIGYNLDKWRITH